MCLFSKYLLSNHFATSCILDPEENDKIYTIIPALMELNNQYGKIKHKHSKYFVAKPDFMPTGMEYVNERLLESMFWESLHELHMACAGICSIQNNTFSIGVLVSPRWILSL